ncbi:MAG: DUF1292 domain-containing protein [Firmicutes bacterium]|nr:DUF1292 domain-containing protein [Bacillota bacterium]
MTDKEIYEIILDETKMDNIIMVDDENKTFEMAQIGVIPMHGVIYAVLDLLKIDGIEMAEDDQGIVLLELDFDEETNEYFVSTVEDDDLFDEVLDAFEELPIEEIEI